MPQRQAYLVARAPLQGAMLGRAPPGVLASLAPPVTERRHLRRLDHPDGIRVIDLLDLRFVFS